MLGLHDLAVVGHADDPERRGHLRGRARREVQVRRRAGQITGIRFYKGTGNTGTHVGNLWTGTGTQLATATFTNETASGWQQVTFATPVSITAGTVYVASYLAPVGHYAVDGGYFATGVDNAPLHALADGVSGGNGVYAYGVDAALPDQHLPLRQLLGRRRVLPRGAADRARRPDRRDARPPVHGSAQVSWTAPVRRRQPAHQLHRHPVHRRHRADAGHGDRQPAGDQHHGERADQRHRLHLHGEGDQRASAPGPPRPPSNSVTPTAPTAPGGADRRDRDGRERLCRRELDRAVERRQRDHQLHGDPVHRGDRADADHRDRRSAGDQHHGDRADQRHRLHLHGDGDQRHRHRARLHRLELGHADRRTAPAAPTSVTAAAANASAQVSWTAPRTVAARSPSYTVTPFIGTTAQTPTTVTGTPPATSTTVTGLTNGTAYTFTVKATNAIGTGPASAASNSVTPSATTCGACMIWPSSATPTTPSSSDTAAVTLGVKFKADVSGKITGIRFYKGTGNTGTHVANLWSATGTQLATGTFTNETASGWQQVNFTTPVTITAGTVYVASYFAPVGGYADDGGFFATSGVDNGLLHALQDGVSGGNGVYAYGSAAAFPNNTFLATNYWVDVVFAT